VDVEGVSVARTFRPWDAFPRERFSVARPLSASPRLIRTVLWSGSMISAGVIRATGPGGRGRVRSSGSSGPYGSGQRDADPPVSSVPECRMAAANEHLGGVDMQTVEPQRCVAAQFMRPHDARSATPGEGN
jgi:hypothetical protein